MRCIVCDRCKKIIEDPRRSRVITCARALKFEPNPKVPYRGNDPQTNDIIWTKEVCSDCLDELEQFFDTTSDGGQTGGDAAGDVGDETTEDGGDGLL